MATFKFVLNIERYYLSMKEKLDQLAYKSTLRIIITLINK